ncbi:hypothetical protein A2G06_02395 [Geobacter anodireducens]|nr:hypothetical protein A2G06_02395 [Geobacter anodireducens]
MKRVILFIIAIVVTSIAVTFDVVSRVQPEPLHPVRVTWVIHLFLWMTAGWIIGYAWQQFVASLKAKYEVDDASE